MLVYTPVDIVSGGGEELPDRLCTLQLKYVPLSQIDINNEPTSQGNNVVCGVEWFWSGNQTPRLPHLNTGLYPSIVYMYVVWEALPLGCSDVIMFGPDLYT